MGPQGRRHLGDGGEHPGEDLLPGLEDGVLRLRQGGHVVELHLSRVGVHHHLDRVADVVEVLVQAAVDRKGGGVDVLGVGVVVAGGVGVENPVDLAVGKNRIGIGVVAQEGCRLLGHLGDVADEHQPRLVGHQVGDEKVEIAEADGEGGLDEEVAQLDAARSLCRSWSPGSGSRWPDSRSPVAGVGQDVVGVARAADPEVDAGLGDLGRARRPSGPAPGRWRRPADGCWRCWPAPGSCRSRGCTGDGC